MLLLDVQQAFDKVWQDGLIFKLIRLGNPPSLMKLIQSFHSDREFQFTVDQSHSVPHQVLAGVLQGSVLSRILFNIFSHDIITHLKVFTTVYTDDIALIHRAKPSCIVYYIFKNSCHPYRAGTLPRSN